jgi:trans-aconitate methyltransferase
MINKSDKKEWETVYGETTYVGMAELIKHFDKKPNDKFIFLDIGSGWGKVLEYVKDYFPNAQCIGIEIDEEKAQTSKKTIGHKVKIKTGDFKDYIDIIKKADVIYSNCIMFYPKTAKVIMDNYNGVLIHNSSHFRSKNKINLQSSWSKNCTYYKLNTNTSR